MDSTTPKVQQLPHEPDIQATSYDDLEASYRRAVELQAARIDQERATFAAQEQAYYRETIQRAAIRVPSKWKTLAVRCIRALQRVRLRLVGLIICCLVIWLIYVCVAPVTLHYDYAKTTNCTQTLTLFPGLVRLSQNQTFRVEHIPGLELGGVDLISVHSCVIPLRAPLDDAAYSLNQSLPLLPIHQNIHILTTHYVRVRPTGTTLQAVPIETPLVFSLSSSDRTFRYELLLGKRQTACQTSQLTITCNLGPLALLYDTTYTLQLIRLFGTTTVTKQPITLHTITAVGISSTSIAQNSTVYSVPTQITITTNKPLKQLGTVSLSSIAGSTRQLIPISVRFKGSLVSVTLKQPLPRQTSFDLHLASLLADDNSSLEKPFDLAFQTSGGPAVRSTSITSFGLANNQPLSITFDQPIAAVSNLASAISFKVNGLPATFQASAGPESIQIIPAAAYPVCATVAISLNSTISNAYGVACNSGWSTTSRSHCYTQFSIGTSVQGRPLTAYQFGSGSSMVLYIANMEGNEQNSANLLTQWIPAVDADPSRLPKNRTIVIIPHINPDGYAADTRLNAAGIDLNRNFPANNWQEHVTEPLAPNVVTNDGGPYPLSAPESAALASYFEANKPRLTLTMHSHGAIVEPNDAADSIALGGIYANLADYTEIPTSSIGNFFDYTTTGAFEDWVHDDYNLPVLEVELQSPTNDEYSRNLAALWAMAEVSN